MALSSSSIDCYVANHGKWLYSRYVDVPTAEDLDSYLKTGLRPSEGLDHDWSPHNQPRSDAVYLWSAGWKDGRIATEAPIRVDITGISPDRFLIDEDQVRKWLRRRRHEAGKGFPDFSQRFSDEAPDWLRKEVSASEGLTEEESRAATPTLGEWVDSMLMDTSKNVAASLKWGAVAVRGAISPDALELNVGSPRIPTGYSPP